MENVDFRQVFFPKRHRDGRRNPQRHVRPGFGEGHEQFSSPAFHDGEGDRGLEIRRTSEFVVSAERDFGPYGVGSFPIGGAHPHFQYERHGRPFVILFLLFEQERRPRS
ncbi:MAG: hypothetical protein WA194_06520 [Patescibacteria group bacterium]